MSALWPDSGSLWHDKFWFLWLMHLASQTKGDTAKIAKTKQTKTSRWQGLNSYQCHYNSHKSTCHSRTHFCTFTLFYSAATRKQECVNTAVYFSSSGLSSAAQPGTIILFTRWITMFMGWTVWKVPTLGKQGDWKIPRKRGKNSRTTTLTYIWVIVTKGDCNCNSYFEQGHVLKEQVTKEHAWPSLLTCPVDEAANISHGAHAQQPQGQKQFPPILTADIIMLILMCVSDNTARLHLFLYCGACSAIIWQSLAIVSLFGSTSYFKSGHNFWLVMGQIGCEC